MNRHYYFALAFVVTVSLFLGRSAYAQNCENFAVPMSAKIQTSPPIITLNWVHDSLALSYVVSRRTFAGSDDWTQVATGGPKDTTYRDTNVQIGSRYEYQIVKQFKGAAGSFTGWGFLASGIQIPLVDQMGTVILLVDASVADSLQQELGTLVQDLIGDGWRVVRHDVSRTGKDTAIKSLLANDFNADPQTRALFIFGHVPVPYSGDLAPDGHRPQHVGAWPADVYYGNFNGTWTDTQVKDTGADNKINWNIPHDGKFDQNQPDAPMDLEVGRVDLWGMTDFSLTEIGLLRQYLNKDHAFRVGALTAPARGMISDNFGPIDYSPFAEAFAATAWRQFPAFFGIENTSIQNWFGTLDTAAYLCAYGCGGGDPTDAGGIGGTTDFAKTGSKAIFTSLFGSWFGDWNVPNDFLRAPLCTTYGLTCAWAGRPQWFYHPMAIGETIGFCTRLTQDSSQFYVPVQIGNILYNAASDYSDAPSYVSTALMGDPTLKLHYIPFRVLTLLASETNDGGVDVSWTPEPDTMVQGYAVYRAGTSSGPFVKISDELSHGTTTFTDATPLPDSDFYMVRGIRLLTTASGSYYEASEGTQIVSVQLTPSSVATNHILQPGLSTHRDRNSIAIVIANPEQTDVQLSIYDINGKTIWQLAPELLPVGRSQFNWDLRTSDGSLAPSGAYFIRAIGMQTPLSAKFILTR